MLRILTTALAAMLIGLLPTTAGWTEADAAPPAIQADTGADAEMLGLLGTLADGDACVECRANCLFQSCTACCQRPSEPICRCELGNTVPVCTCV